MPGAEIAVGTGATAPGGNGAGSMTSTIARCAFIEMMEVHDGWCYGCQTDSDRPRDQRARQLSSAHRPGPHDPNASPFAPACSGPGWAACPPSTSGAVRTRQRAQGTILVDALDPIGRVRGSVFTGSNSEQPTCATSSTRRRSANTTFRTRSRPAAAARCRSRQSGRDPAQAVTSHRPRWSSSSNGQLTCAEGDMQQATELARRTVSRWGRSSRMRPVTPARPGGNVTDALSHSGPAVPRHAARRPKQSTPRCRACSSRMPAKLNAWAAATKPGFGRRRDRCSFGPMLRSRLPP